MNFYSKIVSTNEELEKINDLMMTFPKYERTSIEELVDMSRKRGSEFKVYYSNNDVIGFTFIFENHDYLFLYYIVIDEKNRGLGVGSKILKEILDKNKIVLLNIEPIDNNAFNNDIRLKRLRFYEKNGFVRTNYLLNYENELYEIITSNKKIDLNKYKELLVDFSDNFRKSFICK